LKSSLEKENEIVLQPTKAYAHQAPRKQAIGGISRISNQLGVVTLTVIQDTWQADVGRSQFESSLS
jgi:hypothetical protein